MEHSPWVVEDRNFLREHDLERIMNKSWAWMGREKGKSRAGQRQVFLAGVCILVEVSVYGKR